MPDQIFIIGCGRPRKMQHQGLMAAKDKWQIILKAIFLSKWPQISSQKEHPSKKWRLFTVINIGMLFGISVESKFNKTTKNNV